MEDQSLNADMLRGFEQQALLLEQEQQRQQQKYGPQSAVHPAPSPVPYPYHPTTSIPSHSDRLRRRNTSAQHNNNNNNNNSHEDASVASLADSQTSFRFSELDGLEMPSTNLEGDNLTSCASDGSSPVHEHQHLLPNSYNSQSAQQHRFHQSLNIVSSSSNHSAHGQFFPPPHGQSNSYRSGGGGGGLIVCGDDHSVGSGHSAHSGSHTTSRTTRRRSSFTPQHQLDRRNSRRRVTSSSSSTNSNSNAVVPNRYYIPGNKTVQTEWSSPTRQRRSRNTLPHGGSTFDGEQTLSNNGSSHGTSKPKSHSSLGEDEIHVGMMQQHSHNSHNSSHSNSNNIIVLPSISIPNAADDYAYRSHPSQVKPPAFPQRRACVQVTSSLFCWNGYSNTFKVCVILQLLFVIPLCLYVFDAHAQKKSAKLQLQQYNEEHEHILNQMMWMDQAAKKIKANQYKRLGVSGDEDGGIAGLGFGGSADGSVDKNNAGGNNVLPDSFRLESFYADNSATEDLRDSVHKLRGQMRDMQYRIQQNSIARITEKYGEGPIQVYIHPESQREPSSQKAVNSNSDQPKLRGGAAGQEENEEADMTSEIMIELFIEDTPHAVSTFLYQIERGHWNRVQMNWISETSILSKPGSSVTSGMGDWMQTSRLEFLEQFPIKHCEVSLVQQGQMGVLSLKINLVEVPFQEHEEVCIGRLLNDRLVLPKSREYFMAGFTTSTNKPVKQKRKPSVPAPTDNNGRPRFYQLEENSEDWKET